MHGFVAMGGQHISFRDPFVFLLHSNVDRLFAMWQTRPGHPDRLNRTTVYGTEGFTSAGLNGPVPPWSGAPPTVRPFAPPENQTDPSSYKHPSVVTPPCYDTLTTFPPLVTLKTPSVNFNDVPVGETAARAIVWEAVGCHEVHLVISAGPTVQSGPGATTFGTFPVLGSSTVIPHISSSVPPRGRIWISYTGTAAGDVATGSVTIHCTETNQDFGVPIAANTIARPTVATMLVLDQSGSMDWLAGIDNHTKRMDVLHQAAGTFVQLLQRYPGDGVGMVSFDHAAYPGAPLTQYSGGPFDLLAVQQADLGPGSPGGHLDRRRADLGQEHPGPSHRLRPQGAHRVHRRPREHRALDRRCGRHHQQPDVRHRLGHGAAGQCALAECPGERHRRISLLSGILSPTIDDSFRLAKYFLQILAGVTNNNIVTDPVGQLGLGATVRIPFLLNEADIDATAILLTAVPVVRFLVEAPDGSVMDPSVAAGIGADFESGPGMSFYRFTLPLPLSSKPSHEGTWHALLEIDRKLLGVGSASNLNRLPRVWRCSPPMVCRTA